MIVVQVDELEEKKKLFSNCWISYCERDLHDFNGCGFKLILFYLAARGLYVLLQLFAIQLMLKKPDFTDTIKGEITLMFSQSCCANFPWVGHFNLQNETEQKRENLSKNVKNKFSKKCFVVTETDQVSVKFFFF